MGYKVFGKFAVTEILEHVNSGEKNAVLDGHKVNVNSDRLKNFALHGVDCICCGAKGSHFNLETSSKRPPEGLHLNLYAINPYGDTVLMTKDHVVLKSLGGANTVDNYVPMCLACNNKRGSYYPDLQEFLDDVKNGTYTSRLHKQKKVPKQEIVETQA